MPANNLKQRTEKPTPSTAPGYFAGYSGQSAMPNCTSYVIERCREYWGKVPFEYGRVPGNAWLTNLPSGWKAIHTKNIGDRKSGDILVFDGHVAFTELDRTITESFWTDGFNAKSRAEGYKDIINDTQRNNAGTASGVYRLLEGHWGDTAPNMNGNPAQKYEYRFWHEGRGSSETLLGIIRNSDGSEEPYIPDVESPPAPRQANLLTLNNTNITEIISGKLMDGGTRREFFWGTSTSTQTNAFTPDQGMSGTTFTWLSGSDNVTIWNQLEAQVPNTSDGYIYFTVNYYNYWEQTGEEYLEFYQNSAICKYHIIEEYKPNVTFTPFDKDFYIEGDDSEGTPVYNLYNNAFLIGGYSKLKTNYDVIPFVHPPVDQTKGYTNTSPIKKEDTHFTAIFADLEQQEITDHSGEITLSLIKNSDKQYTTFVFGEAKDERNRYYSEKLQEDYVYGYHQPRLIVDRCYRCSFEKDALYDSEGTRQERLEHLTEVWDLNGDWLHCTFSFDLWCDTEEFDTSEFNHNDVIVDSEGRGIKIYLGSDDAPEEEFIPWIWEEPQPTGEDEPYEHFIHYIDETGKLNYYDFLIKTKFPREKEDGTRYETHAKLILHDQVMAWYHTPDLTTDKIETSKYPFSLLDDEYNRTGAAFGKQAEVPNAVEFGRQMWMRGTDQTTGKEAFKTAYDVINGTTAYPVGSIYMSVLDIDPATIFGGVWVKIAGKYLLASCNDNDGIKDEDGNDVKFKTLETGGEYKHQLTVSELPSHSHGHDHTHDVTITQHNGHHEFKTLHYVSGVSIANAGYVNGNTSTAGDPSHNHNFSANVTNTSLTVTSHDQKFMTDVTQYDDVTYTTGNANPSVTNNTGSNARHNNMTPYFVVNMWYRLK